MPKEPEVSEKIEKLERRIEVLEAANESLIHALLLVAEVGASNASRAMALAIQALPAPVAKRFAETDTRSDEERLEFRNRVYRIAKGIDSLTDPPSQDDQFDA